MKSLYSKNMTQLSNVVEKYTVHHAFVGWTPFLPYCVVVICKAGMATATSLQQIISSSSRSHVKQHVKIVNFIVILYAGFIKKTD
jgi:hypothetical protein